MNRKVKIVCTLGPASLEKETLKSMVKGGLNVARLNFSHGTHEYHQSAIDLVREVEKQSGNPIGVMLDTKGPEIRTTLLEGDSIILEQGQLFELRPDDGSLGNIKGVGVTYPLLAKETKVGQDVFIDDGTLQLKIVEIKNDIVICQVTVGGNLSNRKGINIPDAQISLPAMSEKDKEDILWGVKNDVDYIAVSFVRDRNDILAVRKVLEENNSQIKLIAKIETRKSISNLEEIADVVDGMMIARGDLGVEIPTEDVPLMQKKIIDLCRMRGKPTIVATQMLDSMIRNPRPTRAEANDVSNAVLDGADCVMLSGESAAGKYPVRSVETMARIAERAEEELDKWLRPIPIPTEHSIPDGVSMASAEIAKKLGARAIITLTRSGQTASMVSKYRPYCPVVAATPSIKTCRELCLTWGVWPVLKPQANTEERAVQDALESALEKGYVGEGDLVVITAGFPLNTPGTTNMIRVHTIGEIIAQGLPVLSKVVTGKVRKAQTPEEAQEIQKGEILVAREINKHYVRAAAQASALIMQEGGLTSEAAIVSLELGIPCIVNASGIMDKVETGMIVTVDTGRGLVYKGSVNIGK